MPYQDKGHIQEAARRLEAGVQQTRLLRISRGIEVAVRRIGNRYIVSSKSEKGKFYLVGDDLVCGCKGFSIRKRCRHQEEIVRYIESGAPVDLAKIPINASEFIAD